MNSCCVQPIEVIAEDRHKSGEDCCLLTEKTPAPVKAACPISKTLSRKVQRRTLEHVLKPSQRGAIREAQYYFCHDPSCRLVYFSNEEAPAFSVDDLAVKVFAKDRGDEVPVCYCFDWTRGRIKQEIEATGHSTASLAIAREIKTGNCACDVKNPKGECCLGEVNAFVKELLRERR